MALHRRRPSLPPYKPLASSSLKFVSILASILLLCAVQHSQSAGSVAFAENIDFSKLTYAVAREEFRRVMAETMLKVIALHGHEEVVNSTDAFDLSLPFDDGVGLDEKDLVNVTSFEQDQQNEDGDIDWSQLSRFKDSGLLPGALGEYLQSKLIEAKNQTTALQDATMAVELAAAHAYRSTASHVVLADRNVTFYHLNTLQSIVTTNHNLAMHLIHNATSLTQAKLEPIHRFKVRNEIRARRALEKLDHVIYSDEPFIFNGTVQFFCDDVILKSLESVKVLLPKVGHESVDDILDDIEQVKLEQTDLEETVIRGPTTFTAGLTIHKDFQSEFGLDIEEFARTNVDNHFSSEVSFDSQRGLDVVHNLTTLSSGSHYSERVPSFESLIHLASPQVMIPTEVHFLTIEIESLNVSHEILSDFDLTEPFLLSNGEQVMNGSMTMQLPINCKHGDLLQRLQVPGDSVFINMDNHALRKFVRVDEPAEFGQPLSFETTVTLQNLTVLARLNGLKFSEDIVKTGTNQVIRGEKTFSDITTFSSVEVDGTVDEVDLTQVIGLQSNDGVSSSSQIIFSESIDASNFEQFNSNRIDGVELQQLHEINFEDMQAEISLHDELSSGTFHIPVVIKGNLSITGSLDGLDPDLVRSLEHEVVLNSMSDGREANIAGRKRFSRGFVANKTSFVGNLNNASFSDVIRTADDEFFHNHITFANSISAEKMLFLPVNSSGLLESIAAFVDHEQFGTSGFNGQIQADSGREPFSVFASSVDVHGTLNGHEPRNFFTRSSSQFLNSSLTLLSNSTILMLKSYSMEIDTFGTLSAVSHADLVHFMRNRLPLKSLHILGGDTILANCSASTFDLDIVTVDKRNESLHLRNYLSNVMTLDDNQVVTRFNHFQGVVHIFQDVTANHQFPRSLRSDTNLPRKFTKPVVIEANELNMRIVVHGPRGTFDGFNLAKLLQQSWTKGGPMEVSGSNFFANGFTLTHDINLIARRITSSDGLNVVVDGRGTKNILLKSNMHQVFQGNVTFKRLNLSGSAIAMKNFRFPDIRRHLPLNHEHELESCDSDNGDDTQPDMVVLKNFVNFAKDLNIQTLNLVPFDSLVNLTATTSSSEPVPLPDITFEDEVLISGSFVSRSIDSVGSGAIVKLTSDLKTLLNASSPRTVSGDLVFEDDVSVTEVAHFLSESDAMRSASEISRDKDIEEESEFSEREGRNLHYRPPFRLPFLIRGESTVERPSVEAKDAYFAFDVMNANITIFGDSDFSVSDTIQTTTTEGENVIVSGAWTFVNGSNLTTRVELADETSGLVAYGSFPEFWFYDVEYESTPNIEKPVLVINQVEKLERNVKQFESHIYNVLLSGEVELVALFDLSSYLVQSIVKNSESGSEAILFVEEDRADFCRSSSIYVLNTTTKQLINPQWLPHTSATRKDVLHVESANGTYYVIGTPERLGCDPLETKSSYATFQDIALMKMQSVLYAAAVSFQRRLEVFEVRSDQSANANIRITLDTDYLVDRVEVLRTFENSTCFHLVVGGSDVELKSLVFDGVNKTLQFVQTFSFSSERFALFKLGDLESMAGPRHVLLATHEKNARTHLERFVWSSKSAQWIEKQSLPFVGSIRGLDMVEFAGITYVYVLLDNAIISFVFGGEDNLEQLYSNRIVECDQSPRELHVFATADAIFLVISGQKTKIYKTSNDSLSMCQKPRVMSSGKISQDWVELF